MFAKSPFKPLVSHIEKVKQCVDQVHPLFESLKNQDRDKTLEIAKRITKLEFEADVIKDSIRNQLPQTMFLPVDKRDFMHLLSAQDDIADKVEDLGVLVQIKNLEMPEAIREPLSELVDHVVGSAHRGCDMILELDDLLEASFEGAMADKLVKTAQTLATDEWEADKKQLKLAQALFSLEDPLSAADLLLWNEMSKKLGGVADKTELIGKILRIFISK